jgi:SAM-dependent methyltransferase
MAYQLATDAPEMARLAAQADALAEDAAILFDRIGVGPGWSCLDLGCGLGEVTRMLAARVGPAGRVCGLDQEPRYLRHAEAIAVPNASYVQADALRSGLPADSFDLVHGRLLTGATSTPEALLREALRMTKPGGHVALQENDAGFAACYPGHPAHARLKAMLGRGLNESGHGSGIARRLFGIFRDLGLQEVGYRPFVMSCRAGEPLTQWLPDIVQSLRATLLRAGWTTADALDATLAECRAHLADPGTTQILYLMVQVWGRKP